MSKRGRPVEISREERAKTTDTLIEKHKDLIEKLVWEGLDPRSIAKQVSFTAGSNISEKAIREVRNRILPGNKYKMF